MHLDGTISLGSLISAATFLIGIAVAYHRAAIKVGNYFIRLDLKLDQHGTQLAEHVERMNRMDERQAIRDEHHAARMERYEAHYVKMAGVLQRIIGRLEADRRGRGHPIGPLDAEDQ